MLNTYTPTKGKGRIKHAIPQDVKAEATPAPDLVKLIDEYNQAEDKAHALRRQVYSALTSRKGYRRILVGPDVFNGDAAALAATEYSDPPRLITVVSLGEE